MKQPAIRKPLPQGEHAVHQRNAAAPVAAQDEVTAQYAPLMAQSAAHTAQGKALGAIGGSPRQTAQRQKLDSLLNGVAQREVIEPKASEENGAELKQGEPDQDILEQDPDTRKAKAREALLAAIDGLDGASGEQLEQVLAELKVKYGLSKTVVEVDEDNPEGTKVELYASPALIIGGIALGIVVIVGLGIAGYCIYKRVTYNRLITRLTNAGYTRPNAETLFALHNNVNELIAWAPLVLRQIGDGVAIDQAMIQGVQRQMGAADKLQELQTAGTGQNLVWGQQNGPLTGTALGRWILDNNQPEPDPVGGGMNCWEVVMFSAYKLGYINWQHMHDAYADDVGGGQRLNDYFRQQIRVGTERQFQPTVIGSPRPLRGDIVVFDNAEDHTAMATGTDDAGSPEVFSLWDRPNHNYLQRVTVRALLAAGADEPVRFFSPRWV